MAAHRVNGFLRLVGVNARPVGQSVGTDRLKAAVCHRRPLPLCHSSNASPACTATDGHAAATVRRRPPAHLINVAASSSCAFRSVKEVWLNSGR